jgi:uncharacterized protein with HEPN domain
MAFTITAELAFKATRVAVSELLDKLVEHDPDEGDHVVPGELRRFLGGLRLLHGVPFSYLVPDAELLPRESIRFFYIDRRWTDALVQGALSVGTITTADRAQLEAVYPHIRHDVDEAERVIRSPHGEERLSGAGGTITGFLLRSRAVSGWPGLHVRAYRRDVLAQMLPDGEESFVGDVRTQWAVEMGLIRIGEAVNRIPDDVLATFPDQPWRQIVDMRNFAAHQYDDLDPRRVWRTVTRDVPALRTYLADTVIPGLSRG